MGTYAAYGDAGTTLANRFLNKTLTTVDYGVMVHYWLRFAIAASAFLSAGVSKTGTNKYSYWHAYDTASVGFGTYNGAAWQSYNRYPSVTTWYCCETGFDVSNYSYQSRYAGGSWGAERGARYVDTTNVTSFTRFFSQTANTATWDHWLDDVYIRKWLPSEPQHSSWAPAASWHQAGDDAVLYFITPVDVTVLNGIFILCGLILIPSSTLYLVHGGKDEINAQRIFVFFLVFLFGWALFLGVIAP